MLLITLLIRIYNYSFTEQDEVINIGTPFTTSETEEVDAAATTTNGLYYDIVTLTNETTSDTTDHDDQGSQNNIHSYYGVVIGGGVTFVLFVGVISCTCILLVRQRAKTRKTSTRPTQCYKPVQT